MRTRLTQLASCALLTFVGAALAVGTPAGTVITNRATVQAVPGDSGSAPLIEVSNLVETVVAGVCAVSVTPDGTVPAPGQLVTTFPGERAVFPYLVTNAGNQANTFDLSWQADAAGAFTPGSARVRLHRDTDGDGLLDPGEPEADRVTLDTDASARFVLVVEGDLADRGSAYLDLRAACGAAQGGANDAANVAELRVGQPPEVILEKTFAPAVVKPGEDTTVTLRVRNTASVASGEVVVTDRLDTPELAGLSLVGDAAPTAGTVEYTADGSTWQTTPAVRTVALRWRLTDLPAGEGSARSLTFRLRAAPDAALGLRENVATLRTPGQSDREARAALSVRYTPGIALGPVGNPLALSGGEGSPDDRQTLASAVLGQPVCFRHTLQNTGNVTDDLNVTAALGAGDADVRLLTLGGGPLALPVRLAPGATADFQVCVTPRTNAAITLGLEATSAQGAPANRTTDVVTAVLTELPALRKTVTPEGTVARGSVLTYTLNVTNPYAAPLTNLVVRDTLAPHVRFESADEGGTLIGETVEWRRASLAPGATLRLTLTLRVADTAPDGGTLTNRFTLTSDQTPTALPSNEVSSPTWSSALLLDKRAEAQTVVIGDRLAFTIRVRNPSTTGSFSQVTLTDLLPRGLQYLPGTSTLGGAPTADPVQQDRTLTWQIGTLGPQQEVVLRLVTRVLPDVASDFTNVARAVAISGAGASVAASDARAAVRVQPGGFGANAELIGQVYVDRDLDGRFDEGRDTPVVRARVILAGGRQVLTDRFGRYHFANVPEQTATLRLDPNSVPYPALRVPQDRGLAGSRSVTVRGLTSVDFPLAPLGGDIAALRTTTVRAGPLTVLKTVMRDPATPDEYVVTLALDTTAALDAFVLSDPLPADAMMVTGQNVLETSLPIGTTILSYRFRFGGTERGAVTDPTVRWRYP